MIPEVITVHRGEKFEKEHPAHWEIVPPDGTFGTGHRSCSFCGSLHPEDVIALLQSPGIEIELADMKYGFPHKFYVSKIPNPRAGEIVKVGGESRYDKATNTHENRAIMGTAPQTLTRKFYSVHLDDLKEQPEFQILTSLLQRRTGILFKVDDADGKIHCWTNAN